MHRLESIARDARYAWRSLARRPGFAAVAVITLAEFGILAAIGASPGDQARLVLGSALGMAVPGIAIGLFGTLLLSWLIASRVSGVDFNSPATFALVGLLQLTIAIAAAAIPGRRASRTDPLAALRTD